MKRLSDQTRSDNAGGTATWRNDWHTAFYEALQMELRQYQDVLEFHYQQQLTSEPLRIDCVVIKKIKDTVIKKNIAAIFRKWNLFEYKNPGDYVSVADFYKVYGYACLYTSSHKKVFPRRARKPKGLLPLSDTVDVIVRRDYANAIGSTPLTGRFSGPPGNCSNICRMNGVIVLWKLPRGFIL